LDGLRTPLGRYGGVLADQRPDDLVATTLRTVVDRTGIDPGNIDEVILGSANQAGEDNRNVARMAVLLAGLPESVPGFTVNRLCASGMTAITTARAMIAAGDAEVVVAGGVESMTRAPWVSEKPSRAWSKPGRSWDTSIGWRFTNPAFGEDTTLSMPQTAERVAEKWKLTREALDEFAYRSHQSALAAQRAGSFDPEILPIGEVTADEGPRDSTLEKLGQLRPIHGPGGVITAGNSSSLNDGAAVVVLVSEDYANKRGLNPRARVVAGANAGVSPELMGIGAVPATRKGRERTGWSGGGPAAPAQGRGRRRRARARRLCEQARTQPARPRRRRRERRCVPGDHGHRACARDSEGARAHRVERRRPRRRRTQRSLRLAVAGMHRRPRPRPGHRQRLRRSDRARPPAGLLGDPHHADPAQPARTGRGEEGSGDDVRGRRPGFGTAAGARMSAGDGFAPGGG